MTIRLIVKWYVGSQLVEGRYNVERDRTRTSRSPRRDVPVLARSTTRSLNPMSDAPQLEEMTLRDYASVVWRRKWIVILPMVLTTLVAIGLSMAQTPMYRASAQVLVKTPATAYSLGSTGDVLSPRLVENELQAAKGSELISEVRERRRSPSRHCRCR